MNSQFKYHEPIKEKPLVEGRVIVAAIVSIVFVLALISLVVWLTGRV